MLYLFHCRQVEVTVEGVSDRIRRDREVDGALAVPPFEVGEDDRRRECVPTTYSVDHAAQLDGAAAARLRAIPIAGRHVIEVGELALPKGQADLGEAPAATLQ